MDWGWGRCAGQLAGSLLGFDCSCLSFVDSTMNASVAVIPPRIRTVMIETAAAASLLYPLASEVAEALN